MSVGSDLVNVIKASKDKETKAYDTQATVTRVEGSTVWVHIPGGVDETPVKKTVNAKEGDIVQVRVSGGSAFLFGNASAPPTDDTAALLAVEYARTAGEAADSAIQSAKTAYDAANDAVAAAAKVKGIADEAKAHAETAETAAYGALTQLSIVEDVVGTLNWIAEHGEYEPTEDTEVIPGKQYFIIRESKFVPVSTPAGSPSEQGYYELISVDEAVVSYVSSHLVLTDAGLWVIKDDKGYKVLLSSDGMKVYDKKENLLASFGENVVIGSPDEWHQSINSDETIFAYGDKTYTYLTPGKIQTENMEVNGSYYVGAYSVRAAGDGKLVIGRRK